MSLELLLGHYSNKIQAQSNPTEFAYANVKYSRQGDKVELKQWYQHEGEKKPYLRMLLEYEESYNYLRMWGKNLYTGRNTCPQVFRFTGKWWEGGTEGSCIVDGMKFVTTIRFNGSQYQSRDSGYSVETGEHVFGKHHDKGFFLFERV